MYGYPYGNWLRLVNYYRQRYEWKEGRRMQPPPSLGDASALLKELQELTRHVAICCERFERFFDVNTAFLHRLATVDIEYLTARHWALLDRIVAAVKNLPTVKPPPDWLETGRSVSDCFGFSALPFARDEPTVAVNPKEPPAKQAREESPEEWITVKEAAALARVPPSYISKAAKKATINSRGHRRERRVSRAGVLAWIRTKDAARQARSLREKAVADALKEAGRPSIEQQRSRLKNRI